MSTTERDRMPWASSGPPQTGQRGAPGTSITWAPVAAATLRRPCPGWPRWAPPFRPCCSGALFALTGRWAEGVAEPKKPSRAWRSR
jgi:hypothetical protein